jgi:hypothetical protein
MLTLGLSAAGGQLWTCEMRAGVVGLLGVDSRQRGYIVRNAPVWNRSVTLTDLRDVRETRASPAVLQLRARGR